VHQVARLLMHTHRLSRPSRLTITRCITTRNGRRGMGTRLLWYTVFRYLPSRRRAQHCFRTTSGRPSSPSPSSHASFLRKSTPGIRCTRLLKLSILHVRERTASSPQTSPSSTRKESLCCLAGTNISSRRGLKRWTTFAGPQEPLAKWFGGRKPQDGILEELVLHVAREDPITMSHVQVQHAVCRVRPD
jgi:hypothetical protein